MHTTTKVATALVACLSLNGAAAALAEETPSNLTMKPMQAVSFDIGSKRAVSYFLREKGICKLVLTIAEKPALHDFATFSASRFEASVPALKTTKYRSNEGDIVQFACQAESKAMTVRKVERVADRYGPAK